VGLYLPQFHLTVLDVLTPRVAAVGTVLFPHAIAEIEIRSKNAKLKTSLPTPTKVVRKLTYSRICRNIFSY
jgi:hypothetical protein